MSLNNSCNNLDAYLSHDLPEDARAIFESHLEACPACRDEVDQQQWIDDLLHSSANCHRKHRLSLSLILVSFLLSSLAVSLSVMLSHSSSLLHFV